MTSDKRHAIRILHVIFVMNWGGIERCLMHLLHHIDRDRFQMDFLVHIMPPSCPYTEEIRALGSRIIMCPDPRRNLLHPWRYVRTFKQILREYGPYDIIHSHASPFDGTVLRLAQQVGVPVRIVHCHNTEAPMGDRAGLFRWFYYALSKGWIAKHAMIGLGVSSKAAATMFGTDWKTDPRWQVLHFGIDLTPFREQVNPVTIRAELGIPVDAFVIGHVGRFGGEKNHLFLVEIAAEVVKREPKLQLLLVGDGPLRPGIEQKLTQLGLSDRAIILSKRSDVPELMLGAMDVFLLPSLFEGLGLVLIEAQAAGLPCVVSNVIPEEADVIKPLVRRMSLLQPASTWAEAVMAARDTTSAITQAETLSLVESSPFNIVNSVKKLAEIYQANCSTY